MIDVQRIRTIMKEHRFTNSSLARELKVSQPKISKVLSGEQTLSAESIGHIVNKFNIHPNWIFGYIGNPDKIIYMDDLVSREEVDAVKAENQKLNMELLEVYKQLAQARQEKQ